MHTTFSFYSLDSNISYLFMYLKGQIPKTKCIYKPSTKLKNDKIQNDKFRVNRNVLFFLAKLLKQTLNESTET